ncbi:20284_t:CDS:2, partial [Dentiscutata erythropus]
KFFDLGAFEQNQEIVEESSSITFPNPNGIEDWSIDDIFTQTNILIPD